MNPIYSEIDKRRIADKISETFYLTGGEKHFLLSAGVGEGLFFAGHSHVGFRVIASEEEKTLIESIKKAQTEYFIDKTTTKGLYDKYMEKYESELDDVRASIHQAQLKGKK